MELDIYDTKGKKTAKKAKLEDSIFAAGTNDHAIYLDVKHYMSSNRQGTHKSKERADITGSTKKIKKQKGSGGARAGSIKSPIFRGGGRVFGPRPRDYSFKLNKKLKKVARISALTYKAKDANLFVINDLSFDKPQTSAFQAILDNMKVGDKKSLLVLGESNKNVYLSSRNLKKAKVITASNLSTYEILEASNVVLAESSVKEIEKLLS